MMNKQKCRFCGAFLEITDNCCSSCGAVCSRPSDLSRSDVQKISAFVNAIEKSLIAAKKKADGKTAIVFFLISSCWVVFSFLFYRSMKKELVMVIAVIAISALIFFVVFGFFIEMFEQKAMDNVFKNKIKNEINEYLEHTGYNSLDIQMVAGDTLDDKAALNSYLGDI